MDFDTVKNIFIAVDFVQDTYQLHANTKSDNSYTQVKIKH